SVIELVTPENYTALKAEGVIADGMIPKIDNALKAVAQGVKRVCIKHSDELLGNSGTSITE
ncbi:MAG: acetylglutamate kinase, partial [Rikenellaceae bacterium]